MIDESNLSLDAWLGLIRNKSGESAGVVDYQFPTDDLRDQYISTIHCRTEQDVKWLLKRFLVPSGMLGVDSRNIRWLLETRRTNQTLFRQLIEREYWRRLLKSYLLKGKVQPWEGISWILDLLPHWPRYALEAISAFTLAHAQELPDGRVEGLEDALVVIRGKYIGTPATEAERLQALLELSSRSFECVVERLYSAMGYRTTLTPKQKDGGFDISGSFDMPGRREQIKVECKRYTASVGVEIVRALLGVVTSSRVSRGVLVTTGRFTKPAKAFAEQNPRIELISSSQLINLMSEYFGSLWPAKLDQIAIEGERQKSPDSASGDNMISQYDAE